ncbi:somatostatin receptor type 2-like [Ruditapes philippinarum]|uniref:somatostatin receptor type 2-like n=1 Tax=Ruditapes philippinarum TaxID=129788 RepID=UPI00295B2D95|nr:somatostatin receptor type 2-like [Ruditapes philippinarum]
MEDDNFMNESAVIVNGSGYFYYDYNFNYEETQLEKALKWFETAFMVPIGVLGNILILCVLSKKVYWKSSTAVFLASLAVSDILILVSGFYNIIVPPNISKIHCKINLSIWISSSQTSSCILATVALERAFSVMQPLKARAVLTPKKAKLLVIFIFLCVYGLNAIMFAKYEFDEDDGFEKMYCPTGEPTGETIAGSIVHVYPWVDFCIGFALPFIVIIVCSIIIIIKIKPDKVLRQKMESKQISSVSITLLSANACFIVTLAPSRIYNIMFPIPTLGDEQFTAFLVLSMVSQINAAVNFFVYFFNATKFRTGVYDLFCCR